MMAQMIPTPMQDDVKSPAERRLYQFFAAQLPAQWLIFHSVPWQARNLKQGAKDGEADFVLVHPDYGVLVLEVKGGNVRVDGDTGQWYSNQFSIKDPFRQVRTSMYSLLDVLKDMPYWRNHRVRIVYAVAFPDIDIPASIKTLRPDAPRAIIMDKSDSKNLPTWVSSVFQHWCGEDIHSISPGPLGVKDVEIVLKPSLFLRPLLNSEIEDEKEELLRVTKEQFEILNWMRYQRRALISGCAGSGKTLMAVEKAKRLSEQGFKVLLTCFNYNLGLFLRESLVDHPNIYVNHFHGLCKDLAKKSGLSLRSDREKETEDTYYDETLPSLLLQAADQLNWHVDAVIVDEGQDFQEEWLLSLQLLLNDTDDGIYYIFFDSNQNLYQPDQLTHLHDVIQQKNPYPLSVNCRNTQYIHRFAQNFYHSDQLITAKGPEGRQVVIEQYSSADQLKLLLRRQLHHLIVQEHIPAQDIVVLTPRSTRKSVLWKWGMLGNFQLVDTPTGASGEVFCTTIHQYKGLESPVVIIVELEPECSPDLEKILYVGGSRACHHLVILTHHTVFSTFTLN